MPQTARRRRRTAGLSAGCRGDQRTAAPVSALAVALVACSGAVGKPGEPGEAGEAGEPGKSAGLAPTTTGTMTDVSISFTAATADIPAKGGMHTIPDLGMYFHDADGGDANLTYMPTVKKPAAGVAKVKVELVPPAGTVTTTGLKVTAVGVGTATVMVKATDKDGLSSPAQSFMVTVAAPTTEPAAPAAPSSTDPLMLTAADTKATLAVGKSSTLTVNPTDTVITVDTAGVLQVTKTTETTYTVKAVKKGSADIQVFGADNKLLGTITVTVSNQAPKRETAVPDLQYTLDPAKFPHEKFPVMVYPLSVDLDDFFTDHDGDALTFKATSKNPRNAVVAGISKQRTGAGSAGRETIYIDVIDHNQTTFDIEVTATDKAKLAAEGSVVLTVVMAPVVSQTIKVAETPTGFVPVELGFRKGTIHKLTVATVAAAAAAAADPTGFGFSANYMPLDSDDEPITPIVTTINVTDIMPLNPAINGLTSGDSYYSTKPSSGLVVQNFAYDEDDGTHVLEVEVISPLTHTITVTFHVWEETEMVIEDVASKGKWHMITRKLTVDANFVTEAATPPTL